MQNYIITIINHDITCIELVEKNSKKLILPSGSITGERILQQMQVGDYLRMWSNKHYIYKEVMLNDDYAPRMWWRNHEFRNFFRPDLIIPKTYRRRAEKLVYQETPPSRYQSSQRDECSSTVKTLDPTRVKGQMIWCHKTAPEIEIEGKKFLTPEEIAAGRRR